MLNGVEELRVIELLKLVRGVSRLDIEGARVGQQLRQREGNILVGVERGHLAATRRSA